MKSALMIALVATGLSAGSSAMALERASTTTVTLENGTVLASSKASFDPETGAFVQTGQATLAGGQSFSYAVEGSCDPGLMACSFAGTAQGPMGGNWSFTGDLTRDNETLTLTADVLAPNGRTMKIDRTTTGDALLLGQLLQP